ncbi:MAG: hypothetical protein SNJ71_06390 [Bacteroidales bacterium]
MIEDWLDESYKNKTVHAHSPYQEAEQQYIITDKYVVNKVHERDYKNTLLRQEQIKSNREKSKTRVHVEHVFGFMENTMDAMYINTIGIRHTTAMIGYYESVTYNMFRKIQLQAV